MSKIAGFFSPINSDNKIDYQRLSYKTKSRIQINILILFFLLTFFSYIHRQATGILNDSSVHLVLGLSVITLCLLFYVKYTGKLATSCRIYLFTMLPILAIRIYTTGGIESPLFSLLYLFPILTYIFTSKRFFRNSTVLIFMLICFYVFGDIPNYTHSPKQMFIVDLCVLTAFSMVIYIYGEEKKKAALLYTEKERRSTSATIINRFSHEINNATTVALFTVESLKEQIDEQKYSKICKSLGRITEIVSYISTLQSSGVDTAKFLNEHSDRLNILELKSKGQRSQDV